MNHLRALIIGLAVLLLILIGMGWQWFHSSATTSNSRVDASTDSNSNQPIPPSSDLVASQPATVPASEADRAKLGQEAAKKIENAYNTPIRFYGKVVDQHDEPVEGATAKFGALDKFYSAGSKYTAYSDGNGLFSISDIKGIGLTVSVTKEGYYFIDEKSKGSFAYGISADSHRKPPPTKDNPAVFVLQKMGETEPLVKVETGSIRVPKNGTPVNLSLASGKRGGNQVLRVEAWTSNEGPDQNLNQPYDWRCRVSVPGGGLVERRDQFAFEAPQAGYRDFDEVVFKKTDSTWQHQFNKEYFAKLPDGTYARFKFWFTTGGTHFFEVESYLNPKPGNRNLEFDPEKTIRP